MFNALSEAERDAITAVVFVGTFFITLIIGRFLKRRAGVRLGLLFRLFCLILAFYAAITVYGVHASWRNHVGAAAILLSTALVVALVNRYVWDFYFEKKRQTPIPHFLREVFGGIIFLIVLLLVLSYGYHAETRGRISLPALSGAYRSRLIAPTKSATGCRWVSGLPK